MENINEMPKNKNPGTDSSVDLEVNPPKVDVDNNVKKVKDSISAGVHYCQWYERISIPRFKETSDSYFALNFLSSYTHILPARIPKIKNEVTIE